MPTVARLSSILGALLLMPGIAVGQSTDSESRTVIIATDSVVWQLARADSLLASGSAAHPPTLVNELARNLCRMHAGATPSTLMAPTTFRAEFGPTAKDSSSLTLNATRCAQPRMESYGPDTEILIFRVHVEVLGSGASERVITLSVQSQLRARVIDTDEAEWEWASARGWRLLRYRRGRVDQYPPR
jgi:hypothetical protein